MISVAIVGGAGGVGASAAYNLLARPEPFDVVVADRNPAKVTSHVMDLEQVVVLHGGAVRAGGLEDVRAAGIVVVCASTPLTVNTSRMVYLAGNAGILEPIVAALGPGWDGVLVVVTNPVDPLCTWLHARTGLDRGRVIGYTLNDSLRLRTAVAQRLEVDPAAVEAWVVGEHGDGMIPLLDRVLVGGRPVTLGAEDRAACTEFARTWYRRHVALDSGRSSTWTSGAGVARLVAALAGAGDELLTASVVLEGEYGVDGVALSVPVTVGAGGVHAVHEWPLSDDEAAGMQRAARTVADAAATLG